MKRYIWPFIFCLFFSISQRAWANPEFKKGVELFNDFSIREALKIFHRLESDPQFPSEKRATLYLYLGMSYAYLRNRDKAISYFKKAVQLSPSIQLPSDAPKRLKKLFKKAKEQLGSSPGPAPTVKKTPSAGEKTPPSGAPAAGQSGSTGTDSSGGEETSPRPSPPAGGTPPPERAGAERSVGTGGQASTPPSQGPKSESGSESSGTDTSGGTGRKKISFSFSQPIKVRKRPTPGEGGGAGASGRGEGRARKKVKFSMEFKIKPRRKPPSELGREERFDSEPAGEGKKPTGTGPIIMPEKKGKPSDTRREEEDIDVELKPKPAGGKKGNLFLTLGIVTGGLAAALLGGGIAMGTVAQSTASQAENPEIVQIDIPLIQKDARQFATVANILYVSAGITAAGAITFFILYPLQSSKGKKTKRAFILPFKGSKTLVSSR